MRKLLHNEKGVSEAPFTLLFVLALIILLAIIMTWISAEITFTGIRNTVKNELTAVSIRISEDTYRAMSEGNLSEYYNTLTDNVAYREELCALVKNNISSVIPLKTADYSVENISLTFNKESECIEYVFSCDIAYYVSLFGDKKTVREDPIKLTGKHNLKIY